MPNYYQYIQLFDELPYLMPVTDHRSIERILISPVAIILAIIKYDVLKQFGP